MRFPWIREKAFGIATVVVSAVTVIVCVGLGGSLATAAQAPPLEPNTLPPKSCGQGYIKVNFSEKTIRTGPFLELYAGDSLEFTVIIYGPASRLPQIPVRISSELGGFGDPIAAQVETATNASGEVTTTWHAPPAEELPPTGESGILESSIHVEAEVSEVDKCSLNLLIRVITADRNPMDQ